MQFIESANIGFSQLISLYPNKPKQIKDIGLVEGNLSFESL